MALADPLALQVRNLCDVMRGAAQPLVSGRRGPGYIEGVITAVRQATATGQAVNVWILGSAGSDAGPVRRAGQGQRSDAAFQRRSHGTYSQVAPFFGPSDISCASGEAR